MIQEDKIQEILYRVLQEKFQQLNILEKDGSQSFEFQKLGFKVDCNFLFKEKNNLEDILTVDLYYTATGKTKPKIFKEVVTTFDSSPENAVEKAINEFIELDFSVLSKYYCGNKEDNFQNEVKRLEAVYFAPEQNKTRGWEIYLSKVKIESQDKVNFTTAIQTEMFYQLDGLVKDYFFPIAEERLLKCWVTKTSKPELFADCRVDMKDWIQGRDLLYSYGDSWKEKETQTRKQCILMIPKKVEELSNGKQILDQVKEYAKNYKPEKAEPQGKKWWEVWK